jgi:NAD(P)-dependent dehydrogenase (short-subunit alcohol dehydrogenase family)
MDLDLSGRIALVSGSTAGIGFAAAKGLALAGASVIVNGRTQQRVNAACAAIRAGQPGARVSGAAFDLATSDGAAALVVAHPTVDVLINNFGIAEPKPFADIPDADWFRFFESNVMSGIRLSRAYLPHMREQNWGRILFVSSESALNIPVELIHYGMTKTAQLAVARGIAETVAGTNITVIASYPVRPNPRASKRSLRSSRRPHVRANERSKSAFSATPGPRRSSSVSRPSTRSRT